MTLSRKRWRQTPCCRYQSAEYVKWVVCTYRLLFFFFFSQQGGEYTGGGWSVVAKVGCIAGDRRVKWRLQDVGGRKKLSPEQGTESPTASFFDVGYLLVISGHHRHCCLHGLLFSPLLPPVADLLSTLLAPCLMPRGQPTPCTLACPDLSCPALTCPALFNPFSRRLASARWGRRSSPSASRSSSASRRPPSRRR